MADRQGKGRGRLSSIDLLPPEADPIVRWAAEELNGNDRTQADILEDFNQRLATLGCGPISSSAFGRYSTRLTALTRQLQETREIASAVTARLGPDEADDVTILLVETMKNAIADNLRGGKADPKSLQELGNALKSALAAQKVSAEARRAGAAELRKKAEAATEAAADGIVAATPGADRAAVLKRIREDVYGIFER